MWLTDHEVGARPTMTPEHDLHQTSGVGVASVPTADIKKAELTDHTLIQLFLIFLEFVFSILMRS